MSCIAFAGQIVVLPAPEPGFADTEVSTNIAIAIDHGTREIALRFELDGCASNCIQVAFGRDADGDGTLGVDEAGTLYGWRNGRCFAEGVRDGVRVEECCPCGASPVVCVNLRIDRELGLRHFVATNGAGAAVFSELAASRPAWLYSPDWNMMRVTRRGPGIPAEWFSCGLLSNFFIMRLR